MPDISGFELGGIGPQAKEYGWPLESRKGKETDSPLEPPEWTSPADILILT